MSYLISGSNGSDLGNILAEKLGMERILLYSKTFLDGETLLRFENFPSAVEEVVIVQNLTQPQEFNLFQLLNIAQGLKRRGVKSITAVTPYFCYARADRETVEGDIVSLQTVLNLLESSGIDTVITIDIHNPTAIQKRKLNFINCLPSKGIAEYFLKNYNIDDSWMIVAPDRGALYRAKDLGELLDLPYIHLNKSRNPLTGEVAYTDQEISVKKNVIIVDDITSSGTSIVKSNELLTHFGAKNVHVVISHLVEIKAGERISSEISGEMLSTSTFKSQYSKIDIAETIAEEIRKFIF